MSDGEKLTVMLAIQSARQAGFHHYAFALETILKKHI